MDVRRIEGLKVVLLNLESVIEIVQVLAELLDDLGLELLLVERQLKSFTCVLASLIVHYHGDAFEWTMLWNSQKILYVLRRLVSKWLWDLLRLRHLIRALSYRL